MFDFDFFNFLRKFGCIRIRVCKNYFRCDICFLQFFYEKLFFVFNGYFKICCEGVKVQWWLWNESDLMVCEFFEQIFGDCMGDFEFGGWGFYFWYLLDVVDGDLDFGGYYYFVVVMWCNGLILEWMIVEDKYLFGFGFIFWQIVVQIGICFIIYFCDVSIGFDGVG